MHTIFDVAIVGSGPAGMTAAIYAARANLKVLLIDKLAPGGQIVNTQEIQNYPGMTSVNGADLAIQMFEHVEALGVSFEYGTVVDITRQEHKLHLACEEGQTYEATSAILALGTQPRMLGVPHEERFAGQSISWCAICDGTHYRNKDVIVIGGGNSAVEESIYLASLAKSVQVITLFELTADPMACDQLRSLPNVRVYEYYDIIEFIDGPQFSGLHAVSTKTGEKCTLHADGAFEYIGLKPTADAFAHLGILNQHGYITVDSLMQTSMTGLFAAGDIINKHLRQIVTACNDGAIAAQSAAHYCKQFRQ